MFDNIQPSSPMLASDVELPSALFAGQPDRTRGFSCKSVLPAPMTSCNKFHNLINLIPEQFTAKILSLGERNEEVEQEMNCLLHWKAAWCRYSVCLDHWSEKGTPGWIQTTNHLVNRLLGREDLGRMYEWWSANSQIPQNDNDKNINNNIKIMMKMSNQI